MDIKYIKYKMDPTLENTIFHPKAIKFTFFLNAHGIFSRTDHILGHKTSLNKFTRTELYQVSFLTIMVSN